MLTDDESQRALGYRFQNRDLLLIALTHKSYVNEHGPSAGRDNERFEFLGDAVLDLVVSHLLVERFPDGSEGDLSKHRAMLVSEPALATVARRLGLGGCLRLGRGEALTGGREKASILADGYEALIAAIYLDGGLPAVFEVIRSHFGEIFAALERGEGATVDYKTRLQEYVQAEHRLIPRYTLVAATGPDHDKKFEMELCVGDEVLAHGTGRSKKEAEQRAAEIALRLLQSRKGK